MRRISGRQIRRLQGTSKYHNVRTEVDSIVFDSKAEARRYEQLKLMCQSGEIVGFGRQPSFVLPGNIRYRPDFIVCDSDGRIWVEDVKGIETASFKLKKKLWEEAYSWIPLKVVR